MGGNVDNSTTREVRLVRRHWRRRLAAAVVVALVVIVARLALGPWLTAVVLAAAALWVGLRAWGRIESRARLALPPAGEVVRPDRPMAAAGGHVAFARALAAVSAAYVSECEREANER
jgi:hypothetical protein